METITKNNLSKKVFKILSCDDENHIKEFLWNLLNEEGHIVDFAKNGEEVFQRLEKEKYDLMILDVNMPNTNGYKVSEKICRTVIDRPKILIFTGRDISAEKLQFACSDADAILQKGTPLDDILKTIYNLLNNKKETPSTNLVHPLSNNTPYPNKKNASEDIQKEEQDSVPQESACKIETPNAINPINNEDLIEDKPANNEKAEEADKVKDMDETAEIQNDNEKTPRHDDTLESQNRYDDLNFYIDKTLNLEKVIAGKMKAHEEFIRYMLTEKQAAGKQFSKLKLFEIKLKKMEKWIYIFLAISLFAVIKSLV
ncbi:MAG: response regulator [Elusimicrobiales bacterium]|nr:response regulator [Elusimicrobiales bacterium]